MGMASLRLASGAGGGGQSLLVLTLRTPQFAREYSLASYSSLVVDKIPVMYLWRISVKAGDRTCFLKTMYFLLTTRTHPGCADVTQGNISSFTNN